MTVVATFQDIKHEFLDLKTHILFDLNLVTNAPQGGNYAATLLMVTACEAAGVLRYGKRDGGVDFFRDYIVPVEWRDVSKSVYDALRNGLAHSFATKAILKAAATQVELGISWRAKDHFSYDPRSATLFINVQVMAKNLAEAFERYEAELRQHADLRDRFIKWTTRQRIFEVEDRKERNAWKALVK